MQISSFLDRYGADLLYRGIPVFLLVFSLYLIRKASSRFKQEGRLSRIALVTFSLYYLDSLFIAGFFVFTDSGAGEFSFFTNLLNSIKLGSMGALVFFPFALVPLILIVRWMNLITNRRN